MQCQSTKDTRNKLKTSVTNLGDNNCKDPNYKGWYPECLSWKTTSKQKVEK